MLTHTDAMRSLAAGDPRILLLAMLPIGDTIWISPTVRALRARYPKAYIAALAFPTNAELATCLPGVDEVFTLTLAADPEEDADAAGMDADGPASLPATLLALRERHFDWAVTFTSPGFKWVSALAGIPRRTYLKFDRLWWLLPARHDRWRSLHATQHYYEAARELGLPPWREVDRVPRLRLPERAYQRAEAFLAAHGAVGEVDGSGERGSGPLVAMHPGGAGLAGRKRWPAARFAEVADRLHAELGARVVLLGGPDERALAEEVGGTMRRAPAVVAAGAIPLPVSIALIERCDAFIGDDSGLLHAAAAVGTPYVGIYGPTAIASFRPIPRRPRQGRLVLPRTACPEQTAFVGSDVAWRRPQCEGTCQALETITVEDVLRAALDLLRAEVASETAGAV